MTGKLFAFASVLIVITVVLVTIESKCINRSNLPSRHHKHPSRRDNPSRLNQQLQDYPNRDELRSYQAKTIPGARRKRDFVPLTPRGDIATMRNSSICNYIVKRNVDASRNPMEIIDVICVISLKESCGNAENYVCQQAYRTIDVHFDNNKSAGTYEVKMGCICAIDVSDIPQQSQQENEAELNY